MRALRLYGLLISSLLMACGGDPAPLTGEDVRLPADMQHHLLVPEAVMMLDEPTVFLEDFFPFSTEFVEEAGISRILVSRYMGPGLGLEADVADKKPVATYSIHFDRKGRMVRYEPFETSGLGRNQEAIQRKLQVTYTYGPDGKLTEELQQGEALGRSWMLKRDWVYKNGSLNRINEHTQTELGTSSAVTYSRRDSATSIGYEVRVMNGLLSTVEVTAPLDSMQLAWQDTLLNRLRRNEIPVLQALKMGQVLYASFKAYDEDGRLLHWRGSAGQSLEKVRFYTYSKQGQLIAEDSRDLLSRSDSLMRSRTFGYDAEGNLSRIEHRDMGILEITERQQEMRYKNKRLLDRRWVRSGNKSHTQDFLEVYSYEFHPASSEDQ